MSGRHSFKQLTGEFSPARKERVAAKLRDLKADMTLAELRKARALTQQQLAQELSVEQPAVAKLEQRADMYVSNLRRYIEALGGKLEITATFPEGSVTITNFENMGEKG